ncbi:MAG: thermonuclease family protein, partial [Pseudomonadota bacterium]
RTLVGRRSVTCTSGGRDRFGRALGVCQRGDDPISLNARMVKDGWAIDFGGFAREEGDARRAKRGLWGGTFEAPRDFRDRATSVTRQ